jgi:2'-5' RNA ligase
MRLFLAVKPDRAAEAQIGRALLHVQNAVGPASAALKWTPGSNVHATLHFLGEVSSAGAKRLIDVLGPGLREPPFTMSLGRLGAFPQTGPPRVLWLDVVEGADALARVHAELSARLAAAGFGTEPRPFAPHLTVARVRDRDRAQTRDLRDRLSRVETGEDRISWGVDRVVLFRSDLSGPVPRYEDIHATLLSLPDGHVES